MVLQLIKNAESLELITGFMAIFIIKANLSPLLRSIIKFFFFFFLKLYNYFTNKPKPIQEDNRLAWPDISMVSIWTM